ncbi:MAG: SGNH/GDSL hydrolase family protein [Cyanobacteriota bacterium]
MNAEQNNKHSNNIILNFLILTGTIWKILGVTILWLILVEIFASILISFLNPESGNFYHYLKKECYSNAEWLEIYSNEHHASENFSWQPYVYWKRKPFKGSCININKNGLRQTWNKPLKKNAKPFKIFIFGGSTVWGTFARDENTLPSQIAKLLADKTNYNVTVFNFGEDAYVSNQELLALILEIRKGNIPDIAIFYDGFNDIFTAIQNGKAGVPHNEIDRKLNLKIYNSTETQGKKLFSDLILNSGTNRLIQYLVNVIRNKENDRLLYQSEELAQNVVDTYITNINIIEAIGKKHHFKTIFYWQPVIYNKIHPTEYEKYQLNINKFMENFNNMVYTNIKSSKTLKNKPNFHNLCDLFNKNNNTIFLDQCHVTENGNLLIAKRIIKDILPALKPTTKSNNLTVNK